MSEYKLNSYKSKKETRTEKKKKEIKKVVSGNVKIKQKSAIGKFVSSFVSDDVDDIGTYFWEEIFMPGVKDGIYNLVEAILFGSGSGRKSGSRYGSGNSRVSYIDYSSGSKRSSHREDRENNRGGIDIDQVTLSSKADALAVLEEMGEMIEEYDSVSVADFLDIIGEKSQFTDNNFGWTSLRHGEVYRTRDGYKIRLPKPKPID